MSSLALFDGVEANFEKLERLAVEAKALVNNVGTHSGLEYDEKLKSFLSVWDVVPPIEGWKPAIALSTAATTSEMTSAWSDAERIIRTYGSRLRQQRRQLVRSPLVGLMASIDGTLQKIRSVLGASPNSLVDPPHWPELREQFGQLRVLLGKYTPRQSRWDMMARHLGFAMVGDFNDIESMDWPSVKAAIQKELYGEDEPIPIEVGDLANVVAARPGGQVSTKLKWENIDAEGFERLLFELFSSAEGYENPQWLTNTSAPDRGRDLSVTRVSKDSLTGLATARVIVQCRHRPSGSISIPDLSTLTTQMDLWKHPPVSVLIIATTGRFATDAIEWIEQHNAGRNLPKIEMWPESHLERLLNERPGLIAGHGLR
jgi:hypothetical protein